ncbi:ABC transporter permease [Chengkuizengella axinellae]|uniref:ABC transporter permease n=1 Tax=Chengkuizengella axinellae TaxID=3064388 RepID=A0ABT9IXM5_9BACL|nr:ABC transporter permease [Chengkuizengella sp. 2205SS18-9]MDP5274121.1 ABC transporter permease [Chengkuizengella sp. 2205SS18-9]
MRKALLKKDYKQAKLILWSICILFLIGIPIQVIIRLQNLSESVDTFNKDSFYRTVLDFSNQYFVLMIFIVILSGVLIGRERENKTHDFTFSLPFSRKEIFMYKWMIGTVSIVSAFVINYLISQVIIYFSEYQALLNFEYSLIYFIYPLMTFIALYTLSLLLGTITGGFIYQVILTYVFFTFPTWFMRLLLELFEQVSIKMDYDVYLAITIGSYLGTYLKTSRLLYIEHYFLVVPILYTIIFLITGLYLYTKSSVEHNGKFLLFPKLNNLFMFGIVLCSGLVGGYFVGIISPYYSIPTNSFIYFIGFILFGCLSYYLTKKLFNINLNFSRR